MRRRGQAMENTMKRQTGFSLLELLVAMTVTLIILAATLSLFETGLRTNQTGTQMSTLNGNLRSAMNLIVRDLLQAGQNIPTGGVALPTGGSCSPINRPMPGTATSTFPYGCGQSAPNLPAVIPGNALGPAITVGSGAGAPNLSNPSFTEFPTGSPNSDMITMLYQDYNLVTNQAIIGGQPYDNPLQQMTSTSMTFSPAVPITSTTTTILSAPVNVGDLFLVTGNGLKRLVVVTGVSSQTVQIQTGDAFNLNQQPSGAVCGTISGTICDLQRPGVVNFNGTCTYAAGPPPTWTATAPGDCGVLAQRVLMISYFLDNTFALNGQIVPRLMRQINMTSDVTQCTTANPPAVGCPASVAEVIEGMEFSYDYVNGSSPIINQVTTPTGLTDNQIRKVNIYLAARSDNLLTPTSQYMRNNMATQVDIRSLAFVNRYN